ncbi:Flp family type IVb pilin [Nocardioides lianchengensis]|uniref:Pilus assembly protein Flp/PilA n=1 Tax=Nocardioides lianchengensis TaxID=1045774 RepID=A0A1G6MX72_9ACTN|nr:Flp family type IVb pilin [Nocardioides lianchengensis]NYG10560.1 pilus assembly protein Flp/PilA [Nocardioides lianchengensis]SDC59525.1 pilus assembly protein Flp/PilA [Nocardioides lianchengensis]
MLENLRTFIENLRDARAERRDERGASAVEYGLLVAGIAALIAALVFVLGGHIQGAFQDTCSAVSKGTGAAGDPKCTTP